MTLPFHLEVTNEVWHSYCWPWWRTLKQAMQLMTPEGNLTWKTQCGSVWHGLYNGPINLGGPYSRQTYPLAIKHGWLENPLKMEVSIGFSIPKSMINGSCSIAMCDHRMVYVNHQSTLVDGGVWGLQPRTCPPQWWQFESWKTWWLVGGWSMDNLWIIYG